MVTTEIDIIGPERSGETLIEVLEPVRHEKLSLEEDLVLIAMLKEAKKIGEILIEKVRIEIAEEKPVLLVAEKEVNIAKKNGVVELLDPVVIARLPEHGPETLAADIEGLRAHEATPGQSKPLEIGVPQMGIV